jgi:hypothetical protein
MKMRRSIWLMIAVLGCPFLTGAQTKGVSPRPAPAATPRKVKVAEGKYELKRSNGPLDRTFEESWTLYRTNRGYSVEEQWHVGAGQGIPANILDVSLELIPGLHPLTIRIGTDEQRSLNCSLALTECKCKSMGMEATLPMTGVYNFFSPSPWMLGSIVRRSKKVPTQPTQVQLVRMAGMTPQGPKLTAFQAEVQYVGDDQVAIGSQRLNASIFELKARDAIPDMLVWISADGLVLALQDSAKQEQRMELTQFTRYGKL